MKKQLLFCVTALMLFGFSSYGQATVTISSSSTSDTVCSGTTVTFTATPLPSGSYGYIWNLNGSYAGPSSSTFSPTLPTGIDVVYCLLTNAAGDTIYGASDTLTITVDTLPVISPITSSVTPAGVCIGDTLNLTDDASGGMWVSADPTAATVSSIGTVTGVSVPTGGGGPGGPSVRVYYIMTNSCGSDSTNIRVRVAAPASAITVTAATVCIDSSVTVSDATGGGTWNSSDSTIAVPNFNIVFGMPPTITEIVTGVAVGTVTISYTGMNACGPYTETTDITVVDCSSTAVHTVASIADGCSVYPNPTTGVVSILANSAKYTQAKCTVTNMVGAVVKNATIATNQEATLELNVPTGVYFMTISAGTETYTTKVVVME